MFLALDSFSYHHHNRTIGGNNHQQLHLAARTKMDSIHHIVPRSFPLLDGGGGGSPQLEQLKQNFAHDLSPRRLSATTSVHQLLIQLTQQNLLNMERLNSIKLYLNNDAPGAADDDHYKLNETVEQLNHLQAPINSKINLYAVERCNRNEVWRRSIAESVPHQSPPKIAATSTMPEPQQRNKSFELCKQKIYKLVAGDIGSDWKKLSRELQIKDGQIDRIDERYRDIVDKMRASFQIFEENTAPEHRSVRFCDALCEVRRKDLSRKVVHILME